jgi:hypothetical protein
MKPRDEQRDEQRRRPNTRPVASALLASVVMLLGLIAAVPAGAEGAPSAGSVSAFGAARAMGSPAGARLDAPIVGIAPAPSGKGYWLAGADGGVFSFGDAAFFGSEAASGMWAPFVGIAPTPTGKGYWLVNDGGQVFAFGAARFYGSLGASPQGPGTPVAAIAADPSRPGYWLATTDRALVPSGPVPTVDATCNAPGTAPAVEPSGIILACADANVYLDHLTWSTWGESGAVGAGDYTHNLCQPTCAAGTFVSVPATVRLGYPIETARGLEFAALSFTTSGTTTSQVIVTSPYAG